MNKIIKAKKSEAKKGNGGVLLEGALVGAALGVAAGLLLAPESGKKMRKDIKRLSGDFYQYLAPQVKKLKQVGETEYHALVAKGAEQYAKAKKLSLGDGTVKTLVAEAKRSWGHLRKHMR